VWASGPVNSAVRKSPVERSKHATPKRGDGGGLAVRFRVLIQGGEEVVPGLVEAGVYGGAGG